MQVVFIRIPALRALAAFCVVMSCYLIFRLGDVATSRRQPADSYVTNVQLSAQNREKERKTLESGYRLEILYSSSQKDNIMVRAQPDLLEVPDLRHWSKEKLPECKPGILSKHSDHPVLDRLKFCGNPRDYRYEPEMEAWLYSTNLFCAGRFQAYGKQVAILKEVVLDKSKCASARNGGDNLEELLASNRHSSSEDEYCKYYPGLFRLACPNTFEYRFKGDHNSFLTHYMDSLTIFNDTMYVDDFEQAPTIALTRYEYHNIYHTIADVYNAFLGTLFMKTQPKDTNIVLLDAHPRDNIDNVWKRLFHSGRRINDLPKKTLYKKLLWTIPGHSSYLLNYSGDTPPYLAEFVEFMLKGYAIRRRPFPRDCKKLRVLLIWRRDYLSNVGNPTGATDRKISNERELLTALRHRFPLFTVEGLHMEQLHIKTQLHKVARSDLLIGMHGAGLTHALFLPEKSALIELIPHYWTKADGHFKALACWRALKYTRWVNNDSTHEDSKKGETRVPPEVLLGLVEDTVNRMCDNE